ncbi:MAG: NAD-dependent epimerase/dehydratase family protein [Propionibacteriaceae bacterium]|jgi:nucleoside-diphosphate-sugar epimerase|nr:NAD-dependent epimerase/dehydratase family protein [Propionibacteriaceae bacterium]
MWAGVAAMRRVLFLGGGGLISSAVADTLVKAGDELTIITRGPLKRACPGATHHLADVTDPTALRGIVGDRQWDAIVNWVAYRPADFVDHVELFSGLTGQYVLISTCSVFARPVPCLPITESSARRQATFDYPRGKLECEFAAEQIFQQTGFPIAIIRPFHSYDRSVIPLLSGMTALQRMHTGQAVVVYGDGTSLWSLTHTSDFAAALVPLLGDSRIVGESLNIVDDTMVTWDQIHLMLARAVGVERPRLIHVGYEEIGRRIPGLADVMEHDFRHSMVFDTSKLRRLLPGWSPRVSFSQGARDIVHHVFADPVSQVDPALMTIMDDIVHEQEVTEHG